MSDYRNRILKLVGSSIFAQLISVLSSPILTRIYSPEDFGIFSLFLSFVGILGPISAFNFELVIQRQLTEENAFGVFELGIYTAFCNSILFSMLFYFMVRFDLLGFGVFHWGHTLMVLFTLIAIATFGLSRFMLIRLNDFETINKVTIIRSLIRSVLQCVLGILIPSSFGLLLGETVGRGAGNWQMIKKFQTRRRLAHISDSLKSRFLVNKNYPFFVAPSTLINAAATLMPVVLINKYYTIELAGLYGLVIRAVDLPVAVIGASVADAYYERASNERARLKEFIWKHVLWLFFIALIGAIGLFFSAGTIFSLVFGQEWGDAGQILVLLLPHFVLQFCIFPISRTLHLIGQEKFKLIYDLSAFISATLPFVLGSQFKLSFQDTVFTYSCFRGLSYLLMFVLILNLVKRYENSFGK